MAESGSLVLFLKVWFVLCLVVKTVHPLTQNNLSLCELEQLVKDLAYPDDGNELHAASLRSQLRNLLDNNGIDYESLNSADALTENEKRSLSSIARNGLLANGKRNIGSLARSGFLRASPNEIKRSIAALAKNSQLPTSREPETEDNEQTSQFWDKRNIGSVARSGMMNGKRNIASLARSYELPYGKRNLASVVRSGRPGYKRNIASLARGNIYPYFGDSIKRNVGALARDWSLPKTPTKITVKRDELAKNVVKREASSGQDKLDITDQKQNVATEGKVSPVHEHMVKRESIFDDYQTSNSEILEPVYQIPELDYDDLNQVLNELYANDDEDIHEDKRFLGRVLPPTRASSPAYQHGDHHVNLPQYTNEVFEGHFTQPETTNNQPNAFNFDYDYDNNINFMNQLTDADSYSVENEQQEMLCSLRLNKLISLLELDS